MDKYCPITVARFWSKVNVKKSLQDCWTWNGATRHHGYGGIKVKGRVMRAHRVAWELYNNQEMSDDMHALHKCDNPACCNPRHIYQGSRSDNMKDVRDRSFGGSRKLTQSDVDEIRKGLAKGDKHNWLAQEYGVSKATISKINIGSIWSD